MRSGSQKSKIIYALAPITALSMLPVYHHFYDTKLLLLCLPALAALWPRRDSIAWTALALTAGSLFLTGDLSHWLVTHAALSLNPGSGAFASRIVDALIVFPAPLMLLATGIFYLWIYWNVSSNKLITAS